MVKVLFCCHGNICRSTMAQFVFQDMVNGFRLTDKFLIDSVATSREEIGNPPHRGTVQKMKEVNDKRVVDAIDEAFEKSGINVRLRDEYIEKITAYLTMSHFDTDQTGGEV